MRFQWVLCDSKFNRVTNLKDGTHTSFWYDSWCSMGGPIDITGERGFIDMGIRRNATVASVMGSRGRRHHRVVLLTEMENIIEAQRLLLNGDVDCWRTSYTLQPRPTEYQISAH
ncbi:hypothetical protein Bca4012_083038 [Brassica carinata]